MTPKEYLKQAYRLDHRINSDIAELGRLREMSTSISSPSLGEKVQTNRNKEDTTMTEVQNFMLVVCFGSTMGFLIASVGMMVADGIHRLKEKRRKKKEQKKEE